MLQGSASVPVGGGPWPALGATHVLPPVRGWDQEPSETLLPAPAVLGLSLPCTGQPVPCSSWSPTRLSKVWATERAKGSLH